MNLRVPHLRVVVWFCIAAILGYAIGSVWVIFYSGDAALRGDAIGTWKSFATAAFFFWIGSSSAGKAKDGEPTPVTVENPPENPANVSQVDDPDDAERAGL